MTPGLSLRAIARLLGGEACGHQVLCPGPGHSAKDRSLSIRFSATAPGGFLVHSHAGDDWQACRDYVCERLGLPIADRRRDPPPRANRAAIEDAAAKAKSTRQALALWREAVDPRGTLAETYLNGRELDLGDDLAGAVLRWHPGAHAMLALFRGLQDGRPQAVSRTFLDREGRKIERKFLGPVSGAAIMLDPFDFVTTGLHIGEGVETCMTAARRYDLRPCWALGCAGAVAAFPVLGGVECLTLLQENDDSGRSARDCEACAARWYGAGREVLINQPTRGKDLNDAIRARGAP
jgi:putative DNA primase/helicase